MAVDVTLTTVSSGYSTGTINSNFEAIKEALEDALSRSGNLPNAMGADLDMNGNAILNASVSVNHQVVILENIGGTANAITADTPSGISTDDLFFIILTNPPGTNTSTSVTIDIDGGGAEDIKSASGSSVAVGDIIEDVGTVFFRSGSEWRQLVSSADTGTLDYQGEWDSSTTYTQSQFVTHDGVFYYLSETNSTNEEPGVADPDPWLLVFDFEPVITDSLSFSTWDSGRTQTMKERSQRVCHILDFCSPHATNDNTSDIMNWAEEGQNAGAKLVIGSGEENWTTGDFLLSEEIEIVKAGQVLEFENGGGYAYGLNSNWADWGEQDNLHTRLVGVGTWFSSTGQRVRTRRNFRGSSSDPQDDTMSTMINIQAEGVTLINPALHCYVDFSDTSQSNLGTDIDNGIFIGTRTGVQIIRPQIIGYFRRCGVYLDFSGLNNAGRFLDKSGTAYPTGTVENGSDGFYMATPYIAGSLIGFGALGALPKSGETGYTDDYYDEFLGTTTTDRRGSFGCSDLTIFGGRIYGRDHHSGYRAADPNSGGGSLDSTTMDAEDDFSPACIYLSGLAGNSSGKMQGVNIQHVRRSTVEMFRDRIHYAHRVRILGGHEEGNESTVIPAAGGSAVSPSDYDDYTYGPIAAHEVAGDVVWWNSDNNSTPHVYCEAYSSFNDTSDLRVERLISSASDGEMDIRAGSGAGVRLRSFTTSVLLANETRTDNYDASYMSGTVTVSDDDVESLTPPYNGGQLVLTCMGSGGDFPQAGQSGTIFYDVGSSLSAVKFSASGSSLDVVTTDVSGTDGTDGNTTVAARPGEIKIENRGGSSQTYRYAFLA